MPLLNESLLSENSTLNSATHIALAFSGGADSTCLLDVLEKWCKIAHKELTVLIVNHNLREEALQEANALHQSFKAKSLNVHILTWDQPASKNIHNAARKERYRLLTDYCKENKIDALLTAHHLNDQAETIIHRIFRGTGVDGLVGIRKTGKINGVTVVRPLLSITKKQIYEYLKNNNLSWIEDPSNLNDRFSRSKVRKLLGHLTDYYDENELELILSRFNLLSENAARVKSCITDKLDLYFQNHPPKTGLGHTLIDAHFLDYDDEIALKILKYIFVGVLKADDVPRLSGLLNILKHLRNKTSKLITLAGFEMFYHKGKICLFPEIIKPIWHDDGYYTGSLGLKGWQELKDYGVQKPEGLPHYKILYSLPAKFNERMYVSSVPLLNFNREGLDGNE